VLVSFGIAVAVAAIAVISRNRAAASEARDAIARAIRTAKETSTRKDLQIADREIVTMDEDLAATEEYWQQLLDRLRQAEENSFATVGKDGKVIIKPEDL
jgi:alcohol dehydrogenase class IV